MLCKHEVVGSIPSGSTTLRPPGFAWRSLSVSKRARRSSKERRRASVSRHQQTFVRENITSHPFILTRMASCGISDIVKRRSIRVLGLQSNLRNSIHNLQVISALVPLAR